MKALPPLKITAEEAQAILDKAYVKVVNPPRLTNRPLTPKDKGAAIFAQDLWSAFGAKGAAYKKRFDHDLKDGNTHPVYRIAGAVAILDKAKESVRDSSGQMRLQTAIEGLKTLEKAPADTIVSKGIDILMPRQGESGGRVSYNVDRALKEAKAALTSKDQLFYPADILNKMFGAKKLFSGSGLYASFNGPIEYSFDAQQVRQLAQKISVAAGKSKAGA